MMNEKTYRFKMVNGQIKSWKVDRFVPTNKTPDYSNKEAKKMILGELKDMHSEVMRAERTKSTLIHDEFDRVSHRVAGESTFPKFMRDSGIPSRKQWIDVMQSKKGLRFKRLEKAAIERLERGIDDKYNRSEPDLDFLLSTKQVYDRKDVIFRRVRGRLIPMKVPKDKRYDLMEEAPF